MSLTLLDQDQVERRDAEIHRLGSAIEQGPDLDGLALLRRNETSEVIIIDLSQQLERFKAQVAEAQLQTSSATSKMEAAQM